MDKIAGIAPEGLWAGTNEFGLVNLTRAVFPIVRKSPKGISVHGTGFFVLRNGGFITARHVFDDGHEDLVIIELAEDRLFFERKLIAVYHHPVNDISIGFAAQPVSSTTGEVHYNHVLRTAPECPPLGEPIATYSHPLHEVLVGPAGASVRLDPQYFNGTLKERYDHRGPSGRLAAPYFLTDLHLYGASSGGPIVSTRGAAFAVACTSYAGEPDLSFVTPISLAGDIPIPNADPDGAGARTLTMREVVGLMFRKWPAKDQSRL